MNEPNHIVLQNEREFGDTGDEPLINFGQAVCQCTDADRPVLVTTDGPTYTNVPGDTGELSSDDEPLIKTARASQQISSCSSPEVVTHCQ